MQTQSNCNRITWTFQHPGNTEVTLFTDGHLIKEAEIKRIRVDANCFLVVNEITAKDAGVYTCRERISQKQLPLNYLSVIT
ncbi:hypothetical protein XENOCAPTIV_023576, partial [Xenoophorus captivus]